MPPAHRFAYIDSARAVAAALVVWQHTAELSVTLAPQVANRWIADLPAAMDFGRIGVVVFFAISGFVIPSSLDQADPEAGRTFLIRRFFRLFPAFWLSIPLGVATIWMLQGKPIALWDILLNFTMAPGLFGAVEVMGLYWTLAYELAFYALCLALWRLGWLSRPWTMLALTYLMLALAVVMLLVSWRLHSARVGGWSLIFFSYAVMMSGAVWRRWRDGGLTGRWQVVGGLGVLGAWLVGLPATCALVLILSGKSLDFFVRLPIGYSGGVLIFLALTTVAKVNWRPLAWVGLVSYSLYLFHPVTLYPLVRWLQVHPPTGLDLAGFMAVEFILAIGLAAAVFYAVERPAIAMGRRLSARSPKTALRPAEEVI